MQRSRRGVRIAAAGLCLALLVGCGVAASEGSDQLAVLLYGIVRLSGSELAVSATQAQQLLPLVEAWRRQLEQPRVTQGEPDTAAAIQAILTAEQLAKVEAMHLTTSDVVRWNNGALSALTWRRASRAGWPLPPSFLIEFAGRVIRVLNGWASA